MCAHCVTGLEALLVEASSVLCGSWAVSPPLVQKGKQMLRKRQCCLSSHRSTQLCPPANLLSSRETSLPMPSPDRGARSWEPPRSSPPLFSCQKTAVWGAWGNNLGRWHEAGSRFVGGEILRCCSPIQGSPRSRPRPNCPEPRPAMVPRCPHP